MIYTSKTGFIRWATLFISLIILIVNTLFNSQSTRADPSLLTPNEQRGLEIATHSDRTFSNFGNSEVKLEMILENAYGQVSRRKLESKTIEVDDDGNKSLILFKEPRDVRGTAFLSFTHKVGNDDQWLYLPAIKRVKRISSSNKSGSFMGSEFAFEDIVSQEVEKYSYQFIKQDVYDDQKVFVVERYPVAKSSGYSKQVVWYKQENYVVLKIEYYDRKKQLLKTLKYKGYNKHDNKHWRAKIMKMKNHQSEKSTTLVWSGHQFDVGLTSSDFSKSSLKRIK
ncbi:MAG: outer membrane lipoprotein-sorting protein [Moraxellaceae bacterium]|nr:MAG: outer membrane lipoprotein-sorting protein [Moraxellaceae bacterium]